MLCGYISGRAICRRREAELLQVEGFIALVFHIRDMIDRYLMPLDKIFEGCDGRLLSACGYDGDCSGMEELLCGIKVELRDEIYDELIAFAREIGKGWREGQIKLCDSCINRLSRERDALLSELPKGRRAIMALSLSLSAGVTILLI